MSKPDQKTDDLLESLTYLTAYYGRARSASSILAGLPYDSRKMEPNLFCRAAENCGLKTRIVKKKSIESVPQEILPVVMMSGEDKVLVLHTYDREKDTAEIWNPQTKQKTIVSLSFLKKEGNSFFIYVHPERDLSTQPKNHRHWFWGPFWTCRAIYGRVILATILVNLFALTSPVFIMNVYNRVIPNNAIETGWVLGIGALTVFLFDYVIRILRGYFIDLAGRRIDVLAGNRLYDQLLNIKLAHRPPSSGAFANMLKDFDSVRDFITSASMTVIVDLPFTLFFLFVIYLLGGPLAFLIAALIVLVFLVGALLQIPLKAIVRKAAKSAEEKHGLLIETIHGLETVKAAAADGRMRKKYETLLAEQAVLAQKSRFISGMGGHITTWIQQTASIFVVLMGMYLVKDGTLSVGALIACVLLTGRAIAPIGQVANLMSRYHSAKTSLGTLNTIMAQPVERPADKNFLHRPDITGKITFRRVSFSYPQTNRRVLESASMIIQAGEKVGIIGRIGSGKSTLARLAMGLYDPDDGVLLLDDTDYQQIDPADLRRKIAYIAQDVVLFRGTVRDNITASVPQAREDDILQAAKKAGAHDFIARHPMGYDMPIGERGEGLSGGQRQCVALARAMLLQPKIYICDEPTNAMDTQAEEHFANHIRHETKDKTLILITHRHQLLGLVNRLILMDEGRVILDGQRDEVLSAIASGKIQVREGQR